MAVGCLASAALSIVGTHCTLALVGSLMSWDFVLETSTFLLLVVLGANALVGFVWRRARLGRGELVTVFLMILAAAPAPTIGFLARAIPALGGLTYYASPANRWAERLLPHVPWWLAPRDPAAVRGLFDGLPEGAPVPWGAWVVPLGFWCLFFLVLCLAGIFLSVIFRRQWVERERLAYPIMGVAIGLLEAGPTPDGPPLCRRRMLWAGVAIVFLASSLAPLGGYLDAWFGWQFRAPDTSYYWFSPGRLFWLRFKLSWPIVGLTYLIPLDVSLSCWFFNVLYQLQHGLYTLTGFDERPYWEPTVWGGPAFSGQALGAFLFIGVSSLWLGRRHLAGVWRAALGRKDGEDDADEIVSYRVAVWGLAASVALLALLIRAMGTPVALGALVLVVALISLIALTKIAIHCGLGWMDTPFPPTSVVVNLLGTHVLSPGALAGLGANWIWSMPMRITEMGTASHGLKVADAVRVRGRGLLGAMVLGIVVALAVGCVFQLWLANHQGGVNFYDWFYSSYARQPWAYSVDKMLRPHGPRWRFVGFTAAGAAVAGLMQGLRHRFIGWPFSVVGYAGAFIPTVQKFWFSMFLVWLFKGVLIKYGGLRLYRLFRPFFVGLLMGHALSCGFWYVAYLFSGLNGTIPW